jgi:hypothetical protein
MMLIGPCEFIKSISTFTKKQPTKKTDLESKYFFVRQLPRVNLTQFHQLHRVYAC